MSEYKPYSEVLKGMGVKLPDWVDKGLKKDSEAFEREVKRFVTKYGTMDACDDAVLEQTGLIDTFPFEPTNHSKFIEKGLKQMDITKHLFHPLYNDAHATWVSEQHNQIAKGAEKYPEPLNPASWTFEELFRHAVQENVDQMHYLQAMFEKNQTHMKERHGFLEQLKEMERKKEYWKRQTKKERQLNQEFHDRVKQLEEEKEVMFNDLVKYEHQIKELQEVGQETWEGSVGMKERIEKLEKENAELSKWKEEAWGVMKDVALKYLIPELMKSIRAKGVDF